MRFAVLVSGRGTNLQALLDARGRGALAPGEIVLVLSNRPEVAALERARRAGIEAAVVNHKDFPDRASFERTLLAQLRGRQVEAVLLAGFMRVLTETFVSAYPGRIVNVHPSLLPAFPGLDAPRQAIEHGAKVTGCTVHFVDASVDSGPIIFQRAVAIEPGDDAETLHKRIQEQEHKLLPEAARLLAAGRLLCEGRRVRILSCPRIPTT